MLSRLHSTRNGVSTLRWLALILLVESQLAMATHPLQHHASEAGDGCVVCLQLDRDDQVSGDDWQCDRQLPASEHARAAINELEAATNFTRYRSRASP
ncbi:MAG: hypothetical protein AAF417_20245 [Pseudomonadota bacterium]